jgi:hypothetical protein
MRSIAERPELVAGERGRTHLRIVLALSDIQRQPIHPALRVFHFIARSQCYRCLTLGRNNGRFGCFVQEVILWRHLHTHHFWTPRHRIDADISIVICSASAKAVAGPLSDFQYLSRSSILNMEDSGGHQLSGKQLVSTIYQHVITAPEVLEQLEQFDFECAHVNVHCGDAAAQSLSSSNRSPAPSSLTKRCDGLRQPSLSALIHCMHLRIKRILIHPMSFLVSRQNLPSRVHQHSDGGPQI